VHPTWTTRPRRPQEAAGTLEHRFVSEAVFAESDARGAFVGAATMFNLPFRYGLPKFDIQDTGPVDTVMLRAPLVPLLRSAYPGFVVYAFDASDAVVTARLHDRATGTAELRERVADNRRERDASRAVAHRTFDSSGTSPGDLRRLCDEVARALSCDFGMEG
jgi:guanylate kinase